MPEHPAGEVRAIVKPNLMREKYFMSEHGGTPEQSDDEEPTPPPKKVIKRP